MSSSRNERVVKPYNRSTNQKYILKIFGVDERNVGVEYLGSILTKMMDGSPRTWVKVTILGRCHGFLIILV